MEKNTGVRKHQARNSEPLNAICRERLGSTSCYRLAFADEATSVDWNFSGCCGCFGNQGQALTVYAIFAAVFALTQPNRAAADSRQLGPHRAHPPSARGLSIFNDVVHAVEDKRSMNVVFMHGGLLPR